MPKRRQVITTDESPQAIGPYSQAISAGEFVFVSGQLPIDKDTGSVIQGSVDEQAGLVLQHIQGILRAAGLDLSKVVKATIFLQDMADFGKVNEVYSQYFGEEPPARSCVAVKEIPKGAKVEIEVIAMR